LPVFSQHPLILENILEKDKILEWYVNLAEFGDDVYGITAAAKHYFGIRPELLEAEQAIHLALVLPNPHLWSAGLRKRDLTDFGHKRFKQIAGHLRQGGYLSDVQWLSVLAVGNFGHPVENYEKILAQFLLSGDYLDEMDEEDLNPEAIEQQ